MSVPWWRQWKAVEIQTDACVIGAGVCGLAAALALEAQEKDAIILERATPGSGASMRNAGFLMRGAAGSYAWACEKWGRSTARDLWRWSEENLSELRTYGVQRVRGFRELPSCLLAIDDEESAELERSAALMREDGFEVELVREGQDAAWRSGGGRLGLLNPGDAVVDPSAMIARLRSLVRSRVMTGAEAHRIEEQADGRLRVYAGGVIVVCDHVVVCTNAQTRSVVPELGRRIEPNRAQMLAMKVPGSFSLDAAYYINHGHEYVRLAEEGLVVAGGKRAEHAEQERVDHPEPSEVVQESLERFTRSFLGLDHSQCEVVARWAGTMGFTSDYLPLVGPADASRRLIVCAGFSGHGMSLGVRCAQLAVAGIRSGEWPKWTWPSFASEKLSEPGAA